MISYALSSPCVSQPHSLPNALRRSNIYNDLFNNSYTT
jgi:hypothetical protein